MLLHLVMFMFINFKLFIVLKLYFCLNFFAFRVTFILFKFTPKVIIVFFSFGEYCSDKLFVNLLMFITFFANLKENFIFNFIKEGGECARIFIIYFYKKRIKF